MSPQAIANPDELERFARELKQFNAQLRDSLSRLQGQFANLGETWRDQEHQKFAHEFEQTMRTLHHFMRAADEQIPFLVRKAQRLRNYFGERGASGSVPSSDLSNNNSPSGIQGVSKSHKGPDFEKWAVEHVFRGKRRIFVPIELNRHLEHADIEGHGLIHSRDSDNYVDVDGSLWDAKAYSENSSVDLDQLRDYNMMQDAGYVFDGHGQKVQITSINYLFNSRVAAEKNFDHLFDGSANVWYVEWHEDGTGEIRLM